MAYEDVNTLNVSAEGATLERAGSTEIEDLRRRIQGLQDDVARVDDRVRTFARERPLAAIGVAMAAGFLLGRAMRHV